MGFPLRQLLGLKPIPVDHLASDNCVFCRIANGQAPDSKTMIYEDNHIVVFPDRAPAGQLHLQVVPRRHIFNATSLRVGNTEDIKLGGSSNHTKNEGF